MLILTENDTGEYVFDNRTKMAEITMLMPAKFDNFIHHLNNNFNMIYKPLQVVLLDLTNIYIKNGTLHRIDGPAFITRSDKPVWYINGLRIDDEIKEFLVENNMLCDLSEWTDAMKILFKLRFG